MHFQFDAYTPEELRLAADFLQKLASLQEQRMKLDRLGQNGIDPAQPPLNLTRPGSSLGQVMSGYSQPPTKAPWES